MSIMFRFAISSISLCIIVATVPAGAGIINVPEEYNTIQAAINAASSGDEVLVAPGTYIENLNIESKLITIRSSDGPDVTIIRPTGETAPLVRLKNLLSGSLFEGFTLRSEEIYVHKDLMRINGGEVKVSECYFEDRRRKGDRLL